MLQGSRVTEQTALVCKAGRQMTPNIFHKKKKKTSIDFKNVSLKKAARIFKNKNAPLSGKVLPMN